MIRILEIANGKLNQHLLNGAPEYKPESTSHLLIQPLSEDYLCITNSYLNKSFIMEREDWDEEGVYPAEFEQFIGYPSSPLQVIDLPDNLIEESAKTTTFVIALSYDCNLRCKYCYQQCDPHLDRRKMSAENLTFVLDTITAYQEKHPDKNIYIELFGGEPLLKENHDDVIRIFDYCVDHDYSIGITTNGVNIPYYLKDLVIYSGMGITINTTIDSLSENEKTRFSSDTGVDSKGSSLLKSIYTLFNYDITVHVETNIDQHNIDQIGDMVKFYQENGFLGNPNFWFGIARVDDRRFETGYDKMVTDTQLVQKLNELNITDPHVYYAFVKSILTLCRKLDPGFKQMERKYISNYCWASAPIDNVYYIDSALDVFRCTFTVGRKDYSQFKFSLENLENYKLPNRTYMDYEQCRNCKIGGFCSGGCAQSAEINFDRMCSAEKEDFRNFLDTIYYPRVKTMLESYLAENTSEQKELVS